jgi:hypothetical protein
MELGKLTNTYVVEPIVEPVRRDEEQREDDALVTVAKDDVELADASPSRG